MMHSEGSSEVSWPRIVRYYAAPIGMPRYDSECNSSFPQERSHRHREHRYTNRADAADKVEWRSEPRVALRREILWFAKSRQLRAARANNTWVACKRRRRRNDQKEAGEAIRGKLLPSIRKRCAKQAKLRSMPRTPR